MAESLDNDQGSGAFQYPVHIGTWTNWSRGPVMGRTLTLKREEANLLIAFAAFTIAFVGTRAWRICCFFAHRSYSQADHPQSTIYHQRQAILRNSASPEDGLRLLVQLCWAWRHSPGRFLPLPMLLLSVACISGFTVAGGFSSRVSTAAGDEVLIKSTHCGYAPGTSESADEAVFPYLTRKIFDATNYAQQCYSSDASGLLDCSRFVTQKIVGATDYKAPCPFGGKICKSESTNIRLDTGFIDSRQTLGLNTPDDQRMRWRQVMQCAPLVTEGFSSRENTSIGVFVRYHYGQMAHDGKPVDYIYSVPDDGSISTQIRAQQALTYANFQLDLYTARVKDGMNYTSDSNIIPIGYLSRPDADTYVIFLAGRDVTFQEPTNDPWYQTGKIAQNSTVETPTGQYNISRYYLKEPASPLACSLQYQFCNIAIKDQESQCGPLSNLRDAIALTAPLFETTYTEFANDSNADDPRSETATRFLYFMHTFFGDVNSLSSLLWHLGPTALASQATLSSGEQGPIPPDQWQIDVKHWWDITLAGTQKLFVDTALGATETRVLQAQVNFTTPAFQSLCNSQKIRSTEYASFSLFGLYFIFITSIIIILASYLIEPFFELLFDIRRHKQHGHLEWTTNAALQLQRLAHESLGVGTWSHGIDTIPRTKANEMLGFLDITNIKHPILQRPTTQDDSASEISLQDTSLMAVAGLEQTDGEDTGVPEQPEPNNFQKHEINVMGIGDEDGHNATACFESRQLLQTPRYGQHCV